MLRRALLAFIVCLSACAPKIVAPPVVSTPKFPEFLRPGVPAGLATSAAAINQGRGWTFLQGGDLRMAEREFNAALKNDPAFFPAETSLGYVELARKDAKAALPHFDKALDVQGDDVSALSGRGQALLALNRDDDALSAFESLLAVDPGQAEIRQQVAILRFRVQEQGTARAREAARAGRLDQAARLYATAITSSPDSPFLYRELAIVERQQGNGDAALEDFRKAVRLDPGDVRSLTEIGEILEARGDRDGAEEAYTAVLAIEPGSTVERRLEAMREKTAIDTLPAEYRAIDQAPQITRGELAALIGIRLSPLLRDAAPNDASVITDVRSHWAATWIMDVSRAGVMEPFANHAFQPRTVVRRSDLAQAAARLLLRVAAARPQAGKAWDGARLKFADLTTGHLAYSAASVAVAAGVMKTAPDSSFQPSRPVTGAEAVEAITKIASLAGIK